MGFRTMAVAGAALLGAWVGTAQADESEPEPAGASELSEGRAGAEDPVAVEPGKRAREGAEWQIGLPRRLDLGVGLGVLHRLDDPPALAATSSTALLGGVDLRLFLATRVALTAGYQRFGLGSEETGILRQGTAEVDRTVDALWLGLRVDPFRSDAGSLFVDLGAGMLWQHAEVRGSSWSPVEPGQSATFSCRGSASIAPGLRAELGGEAALGGGLRAFGAFGFGMMAFGDAPLDQCASGAGTAQTVSFRVGLAYAFDLGPGDG